MSNPLSFSIRSDVSITDSNVNGDLQVQGDSTYYGLVRLVSIAADSPFLQIVNRSNVNASSGELEFFKDPVDQTCADGDTLGKVTFDGLNEDIAQTEYTRVEGVLGNCSTPGSENGSLVFSAQIQGTAITASSNIANTGEVARINPPANDQVAGTGSYTSGAGGFGFRKPMITLAGGTYTIDATQSGATFVLPAAAATITLPTSAPGLQYDFICAADAAGDHVISVAAGGGDFIGGVQISTSTGVGGVVASYFGSTGVSTTVTLSVLRNGLVGNKVSFVGNGATGFVADAWNCQAHGYVAAAAATATIFS